MKTTFATLLASVCLLFFSSLQRSEAQDIAVDFDYFYEELTPYGDWIEVEGYGYCFRPTVSYEDETWQPYTVGTWVESDAGWTWMSEEDFGWACYHYGRWLMVDGYWVWVPGYEWGPGWVSWRSSEEYVGWAPLPPEARWNSGSGISSNVDVVFDIGPRYYSFIAIRDFGVDNCRPHLIERSRNVTIINNTINITNITYRDTDVHYHRIYNAGPRFDDIRRHSRHDIRRLKLDFHDRRENDDRRHRAFVENDRLAVFAPRVERREERRPPKEVKARIERDKADRGWKGIEREQATRVRERFAEERKPEGERRRDGEREGPARAIPLPREDGERMEGREGRGPDSPRGPNAEDRDSENRRPGMPGGPNTERERERDGERQRGESDRPPGGPGSDRERGENNDRPGRGVPMPESIDRGQQRPDGTTRRPDEEQRQRPEGMRPPGQNQDQQRPEERVNRPGGSPQEQLRQQQQQQEQRNRERMEERARENQRESRPPQAPQGSPAERMRERSEASQPPQARPRPQENREQERPQRPQVQPQQQQQRQQERERPRPERQEAQRPQPQPQQQERRERPQNMEQRQRPQAQPQQERRQEPRQERQERPQAQPQQREREREARGGGGGGGGERRGGGEGRSREKKDD